MQLFPNISTGRTVLAKYLNISTREMRVAAFPKYLNRAVLAKYLNLIKLAKEVTWKVTEGGDASTENNQDEGRAKRCLFKTVTKGRK